MKNSTHIRLQLASRERLLETFRDQYRIALEYDPESEPDIPIEPETTVKDLTIAFDWIRPKALGPELGAEFGIEATVDEWLAVLTPVKKQTLGDICDFLVARGAELPANRPLRIFGTECETAGAFVAIRSLLAKEGADISDLRPSSNLAAFVNKGFQLNALLVTMNRLAPGVLPEPLARHKKPGLRSIVFWLVLVGFLSALSGVLIWAGSAASSWLGGPVAPASARTFLLTGGISLIGVAIAGVSFIEVTWPSEHIARPGLETFGDLARAVADYKPSASSE